MKGIWQLQEAKSKLSEVVEEALRSGPQIITRRGKETVVVLSFEEYARTQKAQTKLSDFFRDAPLTDIDLTRDQSLTRDDVAL